MRTVDSSNCMERCQRSGSSAASLEACFFRSKTRVYRPFLTTLAADISAPAPNLPAIRRLEVCTKKGAFPQMFQLEHLSKIAPMFQLEHWSDLQNDCLALP
jgi:hypothetical protein